MNWPSIISDLRASNLTQVDIAKTCGCTQSTISEIARGSIKEPKHSLGESLLALHRVKVRPGKIEAAA